MNNNVDKNYKEILNSTYTNLENQTDHKTANDESGEISCIQGVKFIRSGATSVRLVRIIKGRI